MSECCGNEKTVLLYACSGASDVGNVSDRVARGLSRDGFGKMTCVAAIGAGLSGFIESAKGATENITIDGCDKYCARLSLERVGVTPKSYVLTEMGLKKGETSVTDQTIRSIRQKIIQTEESVI
ncbi:putative zinc-binding protein [bacterium]|nr:putative zinc-binding protein [bacterium]